MIAPFLASFLFAARGNPPIRVIVALAVAGVGTIALGAKGFSPEGLPFSSNKNLTGTAGKAVGIFCFLLALVFLAGAAFIAYQTWWGPAN